MTQRIEVLELVLDLYAGCKKIPQKANYVSKMTALLEDYFFYCNQKGIPPGVLDEVKDRYIRELDNQGDDDGGPRSQHGQAERGD